MSIYLKIVFKKLRACSSSRRQHKPERTDSNAKIYTGYSAQRSGYQYTGTG